MGYDLHITRAIDWTENLGLEIEPEEWLGLVRADDELVPDPDLGPYAVRFEAGTAGAPQRWLDWFEGNVFTTDPDHATVRKMLAIADAFSAAVQGDDGEFYNSPQQWSRRREPPADPS